MYLLGEDTASLGIDVQLLQKQVLAGALIAAACVAVSGVIGFVAGAPRRTDVGWPKHGR